MSSKKKMKRNNSRDKLKVILLILSLIETINYSLSYHAFMSLIVEADVCTLMQDFACIDVGSFAQGPQISTGCAVLVQAVRSLLSSPHFFSF